MGQVHSGDRQNRLGTSENTDAEKRAAVLTVLDLAQADAESARNVLAALGLLTTAQDMQQERKLNGETDTA